MSIMDEGARMAKKNALAVEVAISECNAKPAAQKAVRGEFASDSDPLACAAKVAEKMVSTNAPAAAYMLAGATGAMAELAKEVDGAGRALESSLARFSLASGSAVSQIRSSRMALTGEAQAMLVALRDVSAFLKEMESGGSMAIMKDLLDVAERLREMHGEGFASRLAEALLVSSDTVAPKP